MRPVFTKEEFIENVFKAAQENKGNGIAGYHAELANKKVQELVNRIDALEIAAKKLVDDETKLKIECARLKRVLAERNCL